MDGGKFPDPLNKTRRRASIEDKLKVLKLYDEIKEEKEKAMEDLQEPKPLGATRAELKKFYVKKKHLKQKLRKNIQKICKERFPEIVGNSKVLRWKAKSEEEAWQQLPESYRVRAVETNNEWRKKAGLKLKGRGSGSTIPHQLQKELDLLMMEMTSGLSDVSERKEIIDNESIVD